MSYHLACIQKEPCRLYKILQAIFEFPTGNIVEEIFSIEIAVLDTPSLNSDLDFLLGQSQIQVKTYRQAL